MESASYIELFYNARKQEWCAVSYFSAFQGICLPHFKQREIFFVPLFHDSFAMPFTGSTVPPFLRYGVSHSLLSDTRRLTANEKDPSASLPMTIREECVSHTLFLCMMHEISIPYTVISSAARNLPCTLLFLAPFAKGFPFSAVSHRTLYRCARKIPRLRSG